jgi:hypothetical protein
MRNIQIGVIGSDSDLKYGKRIEKLAEEVGFWIGKRGATLVFGAEKDCDSLPTAACRGAKKAGGLVIGITFDKGLNIFEKNNVDVVIATGSGWGGGREFILTLSCDAVVALSGGSGTLAEIAMAYQANIPVVVLKGTGGWSNRLVGEYLDSRKRVKILSAKNPKEAVGKAIKMAKIKWRK